MDSEMYNCLGLHCVNYTAYDYILDTASLLHKMLLIFTINLSEIKVSLTDLLCFGSVSFSFYWRSIDYLLFIIMGSRFYYIAGLYILHFKT